MKTTLLILSLIITITVYAEEIKIWKKCKVDSDCKIAPQLSCGGLCYNKNFEKEAFKWEKSIDWDCMDNTGVERIPRCLNNECICEAKK